MPELLPNQEIFVLSKLVLDHKSHRSTTITDNAISPTKRKELRVRFRSCWLGTDVAPMQRLMNFVFVDSMLLVKRDEMNLLIYTRTCTRQRQR